MAHPRSAAQAEGVSERPGLRSRGRWDVSETLKKVKLDAALRERPEAEKPAMDWEQMAQRIEERVSAGYAGATAPYVSDEKLLAEPLGQIDGEGHNSAATAKPV